MMHPGTTSSTMPDWWTLPVRLCHPPCCPQGCGVPLGGSLCSYHEQAISDECSHLLDAALLAAADTLAMSSLEVDLSGIEEGQTITVKWRGKPVFIKHRTEEDIAAANNVNLGGLRDPQPDSERAVDPKCKFGCDGRNMDLGCRTIVHVCEHCHQRKALLRATVPIRSVPHSWEGTPSFFPQYLGYHWWCKKMLRQHSDCFGPLSPWPASSRSCS
eukprot:scaffold21112_cov19-Tisochrysis_lutea.AAC.1